MNGPSIGPTLDRELLAHGAEEEVVELEVLLTWRQVAGLEERASRRGQTLGQFLRDLVHRCLESPS
jgi:hypothetical protein